MDDHGGTLPDDFFNLPGDDDRTGTSGADSSNSVDDSPSRYGRTASALRGLTPSVLGARLMLALRAAKPHLRQRRIQAGIAGVCALLLALGALLIVVGSTAHKNPPTAPSPNAAEAIIQTPTEQLTTSASAVVAGCAGVTDA